MMNKKKRNLWFLCAGGGDGRLPKAKVDGLLFSTMYEGKNSVTIQKTKDIIAIAKPSYVLVDSGGFQAISAEKKGIAMTFDPEMPLKNTKKYFNLAPCHPVDRAMEMKADGMVALDFPIRKLRDPVEREKEFRGKLHYNVPWTIETAELRRKLCPDIDLFIPVQAYNLQQFEEFFDKIRGIDFDGFSLPIRNMSMQDIAMFLLKMHKWGVKKVHVLGSSSLPVISVCAYMAQFFDWVSFDATSWQISARKGIFLLPDDLASKKLYSVGSYDQNYSCHCKSCKGRTLGQFAALQRKERMPILMTHNFMAIQNLCKKFGETSFDVQYLEKHLAVSKRKDIKIILRCMSEIETMCSTQNYENSMTRNYHSTLLYAHI